MTLPILIHGDAAFPGQGVVAETLNLSRLRRLRHRRHDSHHRQQPARVHGHARRVVQHQLRERPGARLQDPDRPRERRRSGRRASRRRGWRGSIARASGCDFLIDLVGYRRYGHNEGDEPAFTQPVIYKTIASHPTVREIWAQTLVDKGTIAAEPPDALVKKHFDELETTLRIAQARAGLRGAAARAAPPARRRRASDRRAARPAARDQRRAAGVARRVSRFTASSNAGASSARGAVRNPTSARSTGRRPRSWRSRRSSPTASPIRLTGEDVERGTFSHRHAVLHDAATGEQLRPAAGVCRRRARRSRSTTARSARTPRSASSSATTCRSRGAW